MVRITPGKISDFAKKITHQAFLNFEKVRKGELVPGGIIAKMRISREEYREYVERILTQLVDEAQRKVSPNPLMKAAPKTTNNENTPSIEEIKPENENTPSIEEIKPEEDEDKGD